MTNRRVRRIAFLGVLLAALAALPASAGAAESLLAKNFHFFQPPSDGSGILLTYGSDSLSMLGMHYGAYADGTIDHLTVILTNGERKSLIGSQYGVNLVYALGITRYLNVGLAIPFAAYRTFNSEFRPSGSHPSSIEDMRIEAKGILFDRRRRCFGLAAVATVTIPLTSAKNTFLSDETVGFVPRLVFDLGRQWWTVAVNVGYRLGRQTTSPVLDMKVKNELLLSGGVTFRPAPFHELKLDAQFRTPPTPFFGDPNFNYGEAMFAYKYTFGDYSYWGITVGAGMGVLHGAGTPVARFFLGVTANENRLLLAK